MTLELLIVDANVLIDFCKTEKSVLALVTKHIGKVHVAEPVLAEVNGLDRARAASLGLNVLDVEFSKMSRAAVASVGSPLSFTDWLCLHLAEENGWTCVTNDKRLRSECEARKVEVLWGFQLLLRLVARRAMKPAEAIRIAEAIRLINRRIPEAVVTEFMRKVSRIK